MYVFEIHFVLLKDHYLTVFSVWNTIPMKWNVFSNFEKHKIGTYNVKFSWCVVQSCSWLSNILSEQDS